MLTNRVEQVLTLRRLLRSANIMSYKPIGLVVTNRLISPYFTLPGLQFTAGYLFTTRQTTYFTENGRTVNRKSKTNQ